MANFVPGYIVDAIKDRVLAGASIRQISADLQIAKGTVERYRRTIIETTGRPILCKCGAPAFHRGWCASRFAASPARQAFMAKWQADRPPAIIRVKSPPRLDLNYPFIPPKGVQGNGVDLLLLVNGLVPKGLPDQLRGDVCQEILTAVLAGELPEAEIPRQMKKFISRTRNMTTAGFMAFSIDTPRRDGRSWHEVLAAPETDWETA